MTKDILKRMLAAKGEICISIIMPTHDLSRERRNDKIEIKNAVKRAKEKLELFTEADIYKPLLSKLDEVVHKIDFLHNKKGIGIFVSASVSELVNFPVEVEEKIAIGDSFEINEVAYLTSLEAEYGVLLLSEKKVRLLRGKMDQLNEIHNDDFPDHYEDTHEYSKPGRGSSFSPQTNLKGFEKDKSIMEDIRIQDYFRTVDKHLSAIIPADLPLIIVAPVEELAMFEEVSKHNKQVVGTIHGNHTHKNASELADLVFPVFMQYLKVIHNKLVEEFEESVGYGKGLDKIRDIWQAAKESRCRKLLVEKDYDNSDYDVDEILEMVLENKGEIHIVEEGILEAHDGIAAILRY